MNIHIFVEPSFTEEGTAFVQAFVDGIELLDDGPLPLSEIPSKVSEAVRHMLVDMDLIEAE